MPTIQSRRCFILVLCVSTSIGGCVTQSNPVPVPFDTPAGFSETGTQAQADRWWTAFDDPLLNDAIGDALATNFNLATAWERLRAAQAVVDRESGALFPDLEGSAQGQVAQGSGGQQNMQVGLSSVYEVDLWGRIRTHVQAERYRADATFADYQTAALSLSAEVARTWYRVAEAQDQLTLIEAQIETNVEMLNLLENRFGAGQVRSVDILRQRQLVEATREQRTLAVSRVQTLQHQLNVLLGRSPIDAEAPLPEGLPTLDPLPETGVPVELVRRRPDVQSAFLSIRAADRDLASAVSNQYPRLSLSASSSAAASDAGSLFQNWLHSLGGNLLAPIFYGGELRAEVDRSEAVKQQRLSEYGQTVLVAFREVEDALALERSQRESIQSLETQVELAEQAYEQLRIEYFNGTSNYLDVLTALDEVQQLRRSLLEAELALVEYRIALYRALAGPFETTREING